MSDTVKLGGAIAVVTETNYPGRIGIVAASALADDGPSGRVAVSYGACKQAMGSIARAAWVAGQWLDVGDGDVVPR